MAVDDFWRFHHRHIRRLCLLQLEPRLPGGPLFQLLPVGQQVVADGRVVVDVDLALGNVDQPQVLRLAAPFLQILAFEEGFEQFGAVRVGGDQCVALAAVDDESIVKSAYNSPTRRAINVLQGGMAADQFLAQAGAGIIFQLPATGAEPGLRQAPGLLAENGGEAGVGQGFERQLADFGCRIRLLAAFENDDRRVGGDALEHLQITKIDQRLNLRVVQQIAAQRGAGTGLEEGGAGDVAEPAAGFEQAHAQLEKIAVEVGAVAGDGVVFLEVGLDGFQALHAHVGWIAEDDVEAAYPLPRPLSRRARGEDLGEGGKPVEGARGIGGVGDQAVADTQVGFEALQRLAVPGGLEPQRQLGDFDGFGVEVDAIEVAVEDFAVDVEEVGVAGDGLDLFVDLPVLGVEHIEGSNEKSAGAAGGVEDADFAEGLTPGVPEKKLSQAGGVAHLDVLFLGRRGGAVTHFARCGFGVEVGGAHGFAAVVQVAAEGLLDDEGGDAVGRVDDALFFALAADAAAGGGFFLQRPEIEIFAAGQFVKFFEVGDGLLEDVAEDVNADLGGEVVFAERLEQSTGVVRQNQAVENGVGAKQTAVVGGNVQRRIAFVDEAEQSLEVFPNWLGVEGVLLGKRLGQRVRG